jgi:hypothetical protein
MTLGPAVTADARAGGGCGSEIVVVALICGQGQGTLTVKTADSLAKGRK